MITIKYICRKCKETYPLETNKFMCDCGGLFNLTNYEYKYRINDSWDMKRYENLLPVDDLKTLGEGFTPVVKIKNSLYFKIEYMMPTLSFKDRGASVLISKAKELGIKKIIQDSSGNAGAAIAAYAASQDIDCEIFVPNNTTKAKIHQIENYGAKIKVVKGTREKTAEVAFKKAKNNNIFYASHVYNPFFYQGTKTYVYEIFEQFNENLPDNFIIPVGNGTLLLGTYIAFKELKNMKLIDEYPKIIAVQSENCAPIYNKMYNQNLKIKDTNASGIAIEKPKRINEIIDAIKETDGKIVLVKEKDILKYQNILSNKGYYVEKTTAANYAAYHENEIPKGTTIIPLCGSGLKK